MTLGALILVLATGGSQPAAPPRTVAPAPEPAAVEPPVVEESEPPVEDYADWYKKSEKAILKKLGAKKPPSQDRKVYLAWRTRLTKAAQKKLDRFCRHDGGGTAYDVCNGIGPYAIPIPPSRLPRSRRPGQPELIGMTHQQWQTSLSPVQQKYYEEYCDAGDTSTEDGMEEALDHGFSQLCGGTPIVLAFGGERVTYAAGAGTDWPSATTPWLARDLDGDGAITTGAELFGSDTMLAAGTLARHGFEPLVELDANHDGVLSASDPAFASLLVWADADGDRQSSPSELTKLADRVVEISLRYRREAHCDLRGNCEGERSSMTWRDATGALQTGSAIDVYLRYR
jgi:hypothetical protein